MAQPTLLCTVLAGGVTTRGGKTSGAAQAPPFPPKLAVELWLQSQLHIYPILVLFWWRRQPDHAAPGRKNDHQRRGTKRCCPNSLFSPYYASECTLQPPLHIYPILFIFCWWWSYSKNPGLKNCFCIAAWSRPHPPTRFSAPRAHSNLQVLRPAAAGTEDSGGLPGGLARVFERWLAGPGLSSPSISSPCWII